MITKRWLTRFLGIWLCAMILGCFMGDKVYASRKTESVYVLSSWTEDNKAGRRKGSGTRLYETYTYNENGLLTAIDQHNSYRYFDMVYDAHNNMISHSYQDGTDMSGQGVCIGTYNEKNQLIRAEKKYVVFNRSSGVEYSYDKKGRICQKRSTYWSYNIKNNKKNLPVSFFSDGKETKRYSYDSNNNVEYVEYVGLRRLHIISTYNNKGNLAKRKYDDTYSQEETFSYHKITVPSNLVDRIKRQQWFLINDKIIGQFHEDGYLLY